MRDGASFAEQAKGVQVDLAGDDGIVARVQRASQITWDRKNKKFVKGDGIGADNKKMLRTESGARLPASFKSGRFDEWKAKNKKSLPRIGEAEPEQYGRSSGNRGPDGRTYRHNKITEAKPLDPKSNSYERKLRQQEGKRRAAAEVAGGEIPTFKGKNGKAVGGKGGRNVGAVKTEIKSVDQIRKQREALAKVQILSRLEPCAIRETDPWTVAICSGKRRTPGRQRRAARRVVASRRTLDRMSPCTDLCALCELVGVVQGFQLTS